MKINHIHFYVEDITMLRNWLKNQIGMIELRRWVKQNTVTSLMGINEVLFFISAPLDSASSVADYLKKHPSGVADIGFKVKNINSFLRHLQSLKVNILEVDSPNGKDIKKLKIQAWGSLTHTIIQEDYIEQFLGYQYQPSFNIVGIDHIVLNIDSNNFKSAVLWYQKLFNWQTQQTFEIKTNSSSLYSVALIDADKNIKFNINKPTSLNSQIQEFLETNRGAGIQHIALCSDNIFNTVQTMREKGVEFLSIPSTYYRQFPQRYGNGSVPYLTKKEWQLLEENQILLDWRVNSLNSILMQIFTQHIFEKPTFFFEIIERRGQVQGFGENNFQALFEAVEREQFERQSEFRI
ncbi:MAG: 4-hydroxyphenylpyruvate dioxygenase [Microcystaceae cyanobacterium]